MRYPLFYNPQTKHLAINAETLPRLYVASWGGNPHGERTIIDVDGDRNLAEYVPIHPDDRLLHLTIIPNNHPAFLDTTTGEVTDQE